ncbi:MAG: SpoIID/LytB domain-containing protein [Bacteroidales bacterium]|jgi:SpoIID/LytB domain protein|nr:SpoIID/LytB domain-containing protein [Bacteroidales bacterium]
MNKQPVLNVGIMAEKRISFLLETSFHHGRTLLEQGEYTVELKGGKMILQGTDVLIISEEEIVLLPMFRTNSFLLRGVTIGISFHWEKKEDQRFTGGLRFIPEGDKVRVINTVHLEDYLKSVISSEMSAHSSPELLKAHAVISRSWLLAQLEKTRKLTASGTPYEKSTVTEEEVVRWYDREDHTLFDVCADDHCQRYQGITRIISAEALLAVEATTGQVLTSGEGICDTRFSKCCGGISESFEKVWEPEPRTGLSAIGDTTPLGSPPARDLRQEGEATAWILSSPEAFCNTSDARTLAQVLPDYDQQTRDFFRWEVHYTNEELSTLIREKSEFDPGVLLHLEPLERGFSGRITRLRISGTQKSIIVGKELEIRKWLSPSHLYSSAFVVSYEEVKEGIPGKIILRGAGWGHGVGLCQIGAAVMGEKGYSYKQILHHYFRGTVLTTLYKS